MLTLLTATTAIITVAVLDRIHVDTLKRHQ